LGGRRKDMSLLDCFIVENKVVLQEKEHSDIPSLVTDKARKSGMFDSDNKTFMDSIPDVWIKTNVGPSFMKWSFHKR
jgi:hypothetical protein